MYHKQYESAHKKTKEASFGVSHHYALKGLGHYSQMPTNVYDSMPNSGRSIDDQFIKRSVREKLAIKSSVHPRPQQKQQYPSVIGGFNNHCPVGEPPQGWGSLPVKFKDGKPSCVSSSPDYGAFRMDGSKHHGAVDFSGVHHEYNLKRLGIDTFRRRERMHQRKEEDFYKMGRM